MDDEIYAYEQDLNEMDEWEAMHAHEIEAAESEMNALEDDERVDSQHTNHTSTEDSLRLHNRVDSILGRCAIVLEREVNEDKQHTEVIDDDITRKQKAMKIDKSMPLLLSKPSMNVESCSIVLATGERRFLRKKPKSSALSIVHNEVDAITTVVPIADMMRSIEQRTIEKAAEGDMNIPSPSTHVANNNYALWLDKYKPQRFVDLLSDERTNREVLSWIKQWDAYVFPNKKTKSHAVSVTGAPDFTSIGWQQYKQSNQLSTDLNDARPTEKIILICGPPGAGKTTLATIIARHAGYNPIEVNASDDRTATTLKYKIINAMEMQSIWGDQKPNCIILDEIDGAMNGSDGKSAIAELQEIVAAPLKDRGNGTKRNKQMNGIRHPLTRPLICICNDQYASVLRPLRKFAKIFVLDTPNPQRLMTRLNYICRNENVRVTKGVLSAVCASGDNDIRYCVNLLQFQSTQNKNITVNAVSSGLIGYKDQSRSVYETMDMVFYQPKAKVSAEETSMAMEKIDASVRALGNHSLLIDALDENLPYMMFNDPTMSKLCDAFQWLGIADCWESKIQTDHLFAFMAYVPFAARAVHLSCCTNSRRRTLYPKSCNESNKNRVKVTNILQAMADNSYLQPSMRQSPCGLVVDVIPSLLSILTPNIRTDMQSPDEKVMINRLIEVMTSLGIVFRSKFMHDGTESFVLEPPLHELMQFSNINDSFVGEKSRIRPMLPQNVRRMIMREVELERMRKNESNADGCSQTSETPVRGSNFCESKSEVDKAITQSQFVLPSLTAQEEADKLEAVRKRNPFAYAHRENKRKRDATIKAADLQIKQQRVHRNGSELELFSSVKHCAVRYRYNEGYTSGIKTAVYMSSWI